MVVSHSKVNWKSLLSGWKRKVRKRFWLMGMKKQESSPSHLEPCLHPAWNTSVQCRDCPRVTRISRDSSDAFPLTSSNRKIFASGNRKHNTNHMGIYHTTLSQNSLQVASHSFSCPHVLTSSKGWWQDNYRSSKYNIQTKKQPGRNHLIFFPFKQWINPLKNSPPKCSSCPTCITCLCPNHSLARGML